MSKTAIDAQRGTTFLLDPEAFVLVTDKGHPLYDPRVHDEPDENLVRNIMVYGVIEPVIVRKNGDAVEVVAGRQRVKAAMEANKRLAAQGSAAVVRVPCILRRGTEADLYGVTISENEQRREDTPLSRADKAQRLIAMGKTEAEAALAFGVSAQTVRNWLALLGLSAPVRRAVEVGEIPATAAGQLAGLSSDEQRERLEQMKAEGGRITVPRAKRAAKGGDSKPANRMRSRKEITQKLDDLRAGMNALGHSDVREHTKGFHDALK